MHADLIGDIVESAADVSAPTPTLTTTSPAVKSQLTESIHAADVPVGLPSTPLRQPLAPGEDSQQKFKKLIETLKDPHASPEDVFGRYTLARAASRDALPYAVHAIALRRCVPPINAMKYRLWADDQPKRLTTEMVLHPFKDRFGLILDSMKKSGCTPDVSDYNFILKQFVATRQPSRGLRLLKVMKRHGHAYNEESIGLLYRALSGYIDLPTPKHKQQWKVPSALKLLGEITYRAKAIGCQWTEEALDAMTRVHALKNDWNGMESVLKLGFGVDLANPDRHPPEFVERMAALAAKAKAAGTKAPQTPSFTTPQLNAILTTLGQRGDISKMITAFAVITSPMPLPSKPSADADNYGFDSTEDYEPVYHDHLRLSPNSPLTPQMLTSRHTPNPNTKTYVILIENAIKHRNMVVARHFLRAAMAEEREQNLLLRKTPLNRIRAPRCSVSAEMFGPLAAVTRRPDKEASRWLRLQMDQALAQKKELIQWASEHCKQLGLSSQNAPSRTTDKLTIFDPVVHLAVLKHDMKRLISMQGLWKPKYGRPGGLLSVKRNPPPVPKWKQRVRFKTAVARTIQKRAYRNRQIRRHPSPEPQVPPSSPTIYGKNYGRTRGLRYVF